MSVFLVVNRETLFEGIFSKVAFETDGKETTKRIALGTGPFRLADLRSRIAVAFSLPLESQMVINIEDGEDGGSFFYPGSAHYAHFPHYRSNFSISHLCARQPISVFHSARPRHFAVNFRSRPPERTAFPHDWERKILGKLIYNFHGAILTVCYHSRTR